MASLGKVLCMLATATLVAGCAAPKVAPMSQLVTAPNEKLPPVSVFYKPPSKKLKQECASFDEKSALNICNINSINKDSFEQKLRESKYFEQVHSHVKDVEYSIAVSFATLASDSAGEIGNAALSGATLMMVPMKESSMVRTEIAVLWRDIPIKLYEYELPMERYISILQPGSHDSAIEVLQSDLATRFLKDIERDQTFTGGFLNRQLGATDYEKEMLHPKQIGEFSFQGQHIYPHPLAGIQLRFRHKLFDFDYIDAFVYPIRETDWSDQDKVLQTECDSFRKEVELAQREGLMKSVKLGATESISWESGHQIYQGRKISGTAVGNDKETYHTFMYLFMKEDKFIKFRATFVQTENEPNIEEPLKQALAEFTIPKESLFMAKMRQHERENRIQ